jgi:hypothetical protein
MSHIVGGRGRSQNIAQQRAIRVRQRQDSAILANRMANHRFRMAQNLLLSQSAVTQVVRSLAEEPLTPGEVELLADLASDVQKHDLGPDEIRDRLQETRFSQLLQLLDKNEERINRTLMLLITIAMLVLMLRPVQTEQPDVIVIINNVDVDKIADDVVKKLQEEGVRVVQDQPGEAPSGQDSGHP